MSIIQIMVAIAVIGFLAKSIEKLALEPFIDWVKKKFKKMKKND